jgi:hypothetical protein
VTLSIKPSAWRLILEKNTKTLGTIFALMTLVGIVGVFAVDLHNMNQAQAQNNDFSRCSDTAGLGASDGRCYFNPAPPFQNGTTPPP